MSKKMLKCVIIAIALILLLGTIKVLLDLKETADRNKTLNQTLPIA